MSSLRYLARQGLALRGHDNDEGNFKQHLEEKAESDPKLASWLLRNHAYTSPECQNEILQLMSNAIIRQIAKNIHALPELQYSLIMDGTQDISGTEQISLASGMWMLTLSQGRTLLVCTRPLQRPVSTFLELPLMCCSV